jgi:hypothetical protein
MQIDMLELTLATLVGLLFGVLWYFLLFFLRFLAHLILPVKKTGRQRLYRFAVGFFEVIEVVLFAVAVVLLEYAAYGGRQRGIILFSIFLGLGLSRKMVRLCFEKHLIAFADWVHAICIRGLRALFKPICRTAIWLVFKIWEPMRKVYLHLLNKHAKIMLSKYDSKIRALARSHTRVSVLGLADDGKGSHERDSHS